MKNISYRTSGIQDWIEVARRLKSECNWEPVYWVARPSYKKIVNKAFPNTVFHVSTKASRGIPAEEVNENDITKPLGKDDLKRYSDYKDTALKMMDRQDTGNITGDKFGYNERDRLFMRLIKYYEGIIHEFEIDAVVFHAPSPHMIFDYVYYATCVENSVDTVMFTRTDFSNKYYLRENIHSTPSELQNIDPDTTVSNVFHERIKEIEEDEYEEALPSGFVKPSYMNNINIDNYISRLKTVSEYPSYLRYMLNKIAPTGPSTKHYKEKGELIENSSMGRWQMLFYEVQAQRYRTKMIKYYNKLTSKADLNTKYVFFPLHSQPERTTSPEGDVFVDQSLVINLLSEYLPADWILYVKEHPNQWAKKNKGEMGRKKYMYDDISDIDNVRLIDRHMKPFDLIDNAKATVTITGTSGWESVIRGVPAIVFGSAWYRDCPGCIHVKTRKDVKNALKEIETNPQIEKEEILQYVNELEPLLHNVYTSNGDKTDSIQKKENIDNISMALLEWWETSNSERDSVQ